MTAAIHSASLLGIEGHLVTVGVDLTSQLPSIQIVGLAEASVREMRERVRSAMGATGLPFVRKRVIVTLAPADLPKHPAPAFDLPVALAMSQAMGGWRGQGAVFAVGELSLGGHVRPVRGVYALVAAAKAAGHRRVIVPFENVCEAAMVPGVTPLGVNTLGEAVEVAGGRAVRAGLSSHKACQMKTVAPKGVTFADMKKAKGYNPSAMRQLAAAVKARKSILLVGPPGVGAAMIARRIPSLMPKLSTREAMEVVAIQSAAGLLSPGWSGSVGRPLRAPHHTASAAAMLGGGAGYGAHPGEVTLAHRGVLVLDAVEEFPRMVLEAVKGAWKEKAVTAMRPGGYPMRLPSDFLLVGTTYTVAGETPAGAASRVKLRGLPFEVVVPM